MQIFKVLTNTGTITDADGAEHEVNVRGTYQGESPYLTGLPEDCHQGWEEWAVTEVKIHYRGGFYMREFENFSNDERAQIEEILRESDTFEIEDCDH